MKLIVTNKATMPAELIIIAQENLQKLVDETKCPNSKALLDRKVFKAKFGEVLPLLHGERTLVLVGLGAKQEFLQSEYDKAIASLQHSQMQQFLCFRCCRPPSTDGGRSDILRNSGKQNARSTTLAATSS